MKTLIIPCCGKARLNDIPKYLNRHPEGELLIRKCIEGLDNISFDRVVVTIPQSDVVDYDAYCKIMYELKDYSNLEILVLENDTRGPAETVYLTIEKMNISGEIVIKDCDNYVKYDGLEQSNFVVGLNLFEYQQEIFNIRNKSFIVINEQKHIIDIVEKQIKSDIICLGMYGIGSAEKFVRAYKRLADKNYGIKQLYISHIISYLIGYEDMVFRYVNTYGYENWGTDEEWHYITRKYYNCRTKLAIFDLDGTLFDTKDINYYAYKEALEKFGYSIDYEYYCNYCNGRYYMDFLPQITTGDKSILNSIHNIKKDAYEKYLDKGIINRNLVSMAKLLKEEYYLAVVTTASEKNCHEILNRFGIYDLFDLVLTKDDISKSKPDPEGFNKAMEYFGVSPKNTVIFEDSDVGIKAAENSGAFYYKTYGFN